MFPAVKCCYYLSLRNGCIFIALFGIFCSGLNIEFILSILNNYPPIQRKYVFTDDPNGACQLASEFVMMLASIILLISTMVKWSFLIIVYVVIAALQTLYLLIYSIVSCIMSINVIANFSLSACIAYWLWVVLSFGTSPYFIYIAISYYKLKTSEDNVETVP
ncbi:uncharacterized protein LOC117787033 [Drosophila innubila]|uniref:uncharacterized protein LOC117787033 n=1 Tax=Drosophila innubila TaxID=198719 RepID=UPI00148C08D8|nr:uncharacterized protein LOC117787033 [Drosophila innubila]